MQLSNEIAQQLYDSIDYDGTDMAHKREVAEYTVYHDAVTDTKWELLQDIGWADHGLYIHHHDDYHMTFGYMGYRDERFGQA